MIVKLRYLHFVSLFALSSALSVIESHAAVPQVLNHQGRIAVAGVNFSGSGQFKFALVNANGSTSYWSNDGTSIAGAAPTSPVTLTVTKGLYSVLLGDTALANMTALSATALNHDDVRLRVWFNDGSRGFQQISPDQRLAATPYAFHAENAFAAEQAVEAASFTGLLSGDVSGSQSSTSIANQIVTGKFLTGFASSTGTLTEGDSILSAFAKLHGNAALLAPLESPTFTGTVSGITASMVGLGNVNNTSDANKPVSTAQQAALDLKANLASPMFTGTVGGISASMVGLGSVNNTADANKPVSTAQQEALDLKANVASPTFTGTVLLPAGSATSAPLKLATGINLTNPVFGSVEFDGTNLFLTNNSGSPTRKTLAFTDSTIANGAVGSSQLASGLTLGGTTTGTFSGNVTGNATTATTATNFTGALLGDVTGNQAATTISSTTVTGKVLANYASASGVISATDSILSAIGKLNGNDALKAPLANPAFTGTVSGITASMVGLANVDNTSDAGKPVSTAQQTALNLKANLASPTFTGTVLLPTGTASAAPLRLATGISLTTPVFGSVEFDGTNLFLTNNSGSPTRKTLAFTDSTIANGAVGSSQLASGLTLGGTTTGTFSGNVTGNATTATSFTGSLLGDVTGTQGATVISAATVTGKALTGYVSGAGTLSVSDTILTALNKLNGNDTLKANLASPTFTGTVLLPTGTASAAPLKLATGISLTTPVFGSVEFDGTNLYLTTNSATPTRKAVVLSDSGSSTQVQLSSVVAAPLKPVVAWGENTSGQVTVPSLANVANIACGTSHSLALLDNGSVLAWGLNSKGQTTIPIAATGVTEIAAGSEHNLARKSDGTLIAWGNNALGQCTIPANINTATKVAAGANHSIALLADGSLRAWGDNYWGQTTIPSSLNGVTVTAIAAGADHSLALTSAGAVVAWGRGSEVDGLGQNIVPAAASSGVVAIAAGAYHSLALKSNGTVVAWGWDLAGQVTAPASWSGITKIAGGYGFSLGLKSDGTLVSGGDTTNGQATFPADATQITSIAAGANHAMALRNDSIPAQVARLDQDNVFTGKVGIQRTPAINALEVNGSASKSTAGSWLSNSDRRIKTDIESISGALETLDKVRLVDFHYTEDYLTAHPEIEDRRYPNVIAQEFAQVFPDDVKGSGQKLTDGSEILQVDTYPLTIYSAAAVQELHRQNKQLRAQLADQEQRLRKLEESLNNK